MSKTSLLLLLVFVHLTNSAATHCVKIYFGSTDCTGAVAECPIDGGNKDTCQQMCSQLVNNGVEPAYKLDAANFSIQQFGDYAASGGCTKDKGTIPFTAWGKCISVPYKLTSITVTAGACAVKDTVNASIFKKRFDTADCKGKSEDKYMPFGKAQAQLKLACYQTGTTDSKKIACKNGNIDVSEFNTKDCSGTAGTKYTVSETCSQSTDGAGTKKTESYQLQSSSAASLRLLCPLKTCANGTAVVADGTGEGKCSKCNTGFTLKTDKCVSTNTCTCANGTAAVGTACATDKAAKCTACKTGFELAQDACTVKSSTATLVLTSLVSLIMLFF